MRWAAILAPARSCDAPLRSGISGARRGSFRKQSEKGGSSAKFVAAGIVEFVGEGGDEQKRLEDIRSTYERDTRLLYDSQIFKRLIAATTIESVVNAWRGCMANKTLMSFYTGDPSSEFVVLLALYASRQLTPAFG